MADTRSAVKDMAAAIVVGAGPLPAELARRVRRRRRRIGTVAGLAGAAVVVVVAVTVLVPRTVSPRAGRVEQPGQAFVLAAGRHALAASGGPPVGSMGVVGPSQLWVLDGDGLFVTGAGGRGWKRVAPPSADDPLADYLAVDFVSLQRGWVIASKENSIAVDRTADGGSAWQSVTLPASLFPGGWNSAEVSFVTSSRGWLLVQPYPQPGHPDQSVVLSTTDGGARWTSVDLAAPVIAAAFTGPAAGWGLGSGGTSLYHSSDGGRSWQPVTLPRPGSRVGGWSALTLPQFTGRDGVLLAVPAAGHAVTETTTDGGQTWHAQPAPFTGEPTYPQPAGSGQQATCTGCVAVGDEPFAVLSPAEWRYWAGGLLYTTTDAGRHWSWVQPNLAFASLGTTLGRVGVDNEGPADPLQYTSPQTGWALASASGASGQQSVLLVTTDDDATFTAVSPPRGPLPIRGSSASSG
jgi:photosystem II stability/assembly factor-like uncharacterized protein